MDLNQNFWPLFIINLPLVVALFVALQKGWIVIGRTHLEQLDSKDKEIAFREEMRQEALKDKQALLVQNKEIQTALKELSTVVQHSLELNEHLVNQDLERRWDGNDRRSK